VGEGAADVIVRLYSHKGLKTPAYSSVVCNYMGGEGGGG